MKRKRKEACPSPTLDDSPKRVRVQAQRKFAQNAGAHSPIITPIRDSETADLPLNNISPEPVELLPMKRQSTDDFLTFLCFRGTPILPSTLQFFNTASIVSDGQVHEIKSESAKNGPIDITKCASNSAEKPFIAFGVRKRADPIVISRQMEKKRRHALAIQALRRKYQEQKMAKIRALTISKLSEKTTNKTLVRTNTIQKTETVTKKTNSTLEKTKVIATKHVKVTTETLKTKVKPKMCLRSFRGKFVQKELPFRPRRPLPEREGIVKLNNMTRTSRNSTTGREKALNSSQTENRGSTDNQARSDSASSSTISPTLSPGTSKRPQIKRRILLPSTLVTTIIKPKLRSTTVKKTVISRRKAQQRLRTSLVKKDSPKKTSPLKGESSLRQENQEISRRLTRKDSELGKSPPKEVKKELTKNIALKKEVKIAENEAKKTVKKSTNFKKEFNLKSPNKDIKRNIILQKTSDLVLEKSDSGQKMVTRDLKTVEVSVKKMTTRRSEEGKLKEKIDLEKNPKSIAQNNLKKISKTLKVPPASLDKEENAPSKAAQNKLLKVNDNVKRVARVGLKPAEDQVKVTKEPKKLKERKKETFPCKKIDDEFTKKIQNLIDVALKEACDSPAEKSTSLKTSETIQAVKDEKEDIVKVVDVKKCILQEKPVMKEEPQVKMHEEKPVIKDESKEVELKPKKITNKMEQSKRKLSLPSDESDQITPTAPTRPSRKTKEAAAIYMEILSHKLVNEAMVDDDNGSIDSFPELPNVKKTEQREIELKAQAKSVELVESKKTVCKKLASDNEELDCIKSEEDSDNEVLQAKVKKSTLKEQKVLNLTASLEETNTKRLTRRSNQTVKDSDNDSSDESFHLDIRVPRKKKNTRSRNKSTTSVLEKNVDIILEAARVLAEGEDPSKASSDESTTSDINLKCLQMKQRNKKMTKKKGSKSSTKSLGSFSDSDEEPLAKLTKPIMKSVSESEESKKKTEKSKVSLKKPADSATIMEPKPKRECTKRPSNYLPMLSSSEEDDEPYFHGFKTDLDKPKVFIQTLAPSLELLSQDMGRKGKVNMSNEQIEQWLKDSALASSSVAKENDAMLKFGEKIPSDTSPSETASSLKSGESKSKLEPRPGCSRTLSLDEKSKSEVKSPFADRKWIFKKDKKEMTPNKNAFSPENECSVYAFGEDSEEIISTPFRRPSRRPSSTATSRSEDELSKSEDPKLGQFRKPNPSDSEDSRCFNIPQNPSSKLLMVPPSSYHSKRQSKPSIEKFPEPFDDSKYKVPSSPSASSGSSTKLYKKGVQKHKNRIFEPINPVFVSDFPKPTDPGKLVEAPVFHPTEQEFQDPLEYIERIRHKAEQFGICKIVPPSSFKPECKVSDDMRFTSYNQYVHKMLHRWGPNFKEFIAIKKYLATQSIFLKTAPLIGGMEIDLPRLYQTVQSLGGLKEVIEKKKWPKVSDQMKIPKSAQDRVTKLDDIYCKYLLPYDTLSPAEREKLFDEIETYWKKKVSKNFQDMKQEESSDIVDSDDNDAEECTVKGRNMALNAFYRIARNTMAMYFKTSEPTALEVEQEFWRYVTQKQNHICVHSASIDCGTWGYGFAVSKNSPFAKHPWNLKVLSNNNGSVLRSLGPVMGVTVPTLHVGMVFSTCCWYRDPHGLPWVEYLHTGGNKIWYGIPSASCEVFHAAMQKLVPDYCRDKELWLPSDTAMVPPAMLIEQNVSLCRTIQEPGQFLVVFPKVYTSSISTGYVVSESVYFAPLYWLKTAKSLFNDLKTSCEPSMFSLDKLLISIINDNRSSVEVLRVILPYIEELCASENTNRIQLKKFSGIGEEKMSNSDSQKKKKIQSVDGDFECEICRTNLHVSMVLDTQEDLIYCLEDAVKLVKSNGKMSERLRLRYNLNEDEVGAMPKKLYLAIESKLQKKVIPGKFAGLPTLLK